ncbi:MAG: hypothetical protein QQN63_03560 [Nitrosopumilus sp.]
MALRDLFSGAFRGGFTSGKGFLPDFGRKTKDRQAQVFQVGEGLSPQQTKVAQTTVRQSTVPNQTIAPLANQSFSQLGGGGTAPGGGNQLSAENIAGTVDTTAYDDTAARLQQEFDTRESQAREQASGIFEPLISAAGGQIGRLGEELTTLQGGISRGAEASQGLVGSQLEAVRNTLGLQEEDIRGRTKKSLRSLAEDTRNITTATARRLGARGAGDTSAGDLATSAIGRQGLKQRGLALESQETGFREIEGRRVEAQNIANQENLRIESSKQQQLTSLAADFQRIQRELENAMATATSDERRFIVDQQNALRDELSTRLSDLETEARQRKAALTDWFTQQEATLQFGLQRILSSGRFDASDVIGNISKASQIIGNTSLSPAGQQFITEQLGVPAGLFSFGGESDEDRLRRLSAEADLRDRGIDPATGQSLAVEEGGGALRNLFTPGDQPGFF